MYELDVLFVVDALPETGFGHAARCLSLGRLLRAHEPAIRVGFQGSFSDSARRLMLQHFAENDFCGTREGKPAAVSVIDRMHDIQDADSWDTELLADVQVRSGAVVHLTSGTRDPKLPDGVTCIGFQPSGPAPRPPHLLWGLEYAPVSLSLGQTAADVDKDEGRLLVALGGAQDASAIELVLQAAATIPTIKTIDLLGSPVNDPSLRDAARQFEGRLEIHNAVPDVVPLLRRARVVLASFGHLVYEALAWGTAACVIGQKRFQAEYADLLEKEGLAISAGYAPQAAPRSVADALRRAWDDADQLSARGRSAVDGQGLDRIAEILHVLIARAV